MKQNEMSAIYKWIIGVLLSLNGFFLIKVSDKIDTTLDIAIEARSSQRVQDVKILHMESLLNKHDKKIDYIYEVKKREVSKSKYLKSNSDEDEQ